LYRYSRFSLNQCRFQPAVRTEKRRGLHPKNFNPAPLSHTKGHHRTAPISFPPNPNPSHRLRRSSTTTPPHAASAAPTVMSPRVCTLIRDPDLLSLLAAPPLSIDHGRCWLEVSSSRAGCRRQGGRGGAGGGVQLGGRRGRCPGGCGGGRAQGRGGAAQGEDLYLRSVAKARFRFCFIISLVRGHVD
jgi:hypothetical protein